jgi:16S rRNA (guanine527-N7)-methyltransferase
VSDLSARLAALGHAAGVALNERQLRGLESYLHLLARWNATINLTSLSLDGFPDATLNRLIAEPLIASKYMPSSEAVAGATWFDLGTGGGSPAIPLKLVCPNPALTMVESKERKGAFLREAVRALQLANADVASWRIEETNSVNVDIITVRAVYGNKVLAEAVSRMLSPAGTVLVFASAKPDLPGLRVTSEVPLISPGDSLFVMTRST